MNATAEDLRRADATCQLEALRAGETSAIELLEAHLAAIARLDPLLGAFWHLDPDSARRQAADSDRRLAAGRARPLEGLMVAIKDNIDVTGMPTTAGMATRRGRIAVKDAEVVARLREAGAIILGKLAMHEAALGADNDNPHFGRCHNPHRLGHTPGGSSGGSAAAVAAGLCAMALGTDSMGSVRIPGAYCGVFAFKPSLGGVSTRGVVPVSARLDTVGWLARSARDLQLLHPLLADTRPSGAASLAKGCRDRAGEAPRRLLALDPGGQCEPPVAEGFAHALAACDRLGVDLARAALPAALGRWRRAGLLLCEAEMLIVHETDWRERRALFSERLATLLAFAERKSAADLARALLTIDQAREFLAETLARAEALLLPTTPQRAFPFGGEPPPDQADFTCLASLAGAPAVQIPLFPESGGLPCGVQLVAAGGGESALFTLTQALATALAIAVEPVEPLP